MAASDNSEVAPSGLKHIGSCECGLLSCNDPELNIHEAIIYCEKRNRHKEFIPIRDINLSHLPERYRDEHILKLIKVQADLTVLINVERSSKNRPKVSKDELSRQELCETADGSAGTASVVRVEKNNDDEVCYCKTHRTSGGPDKIRGAIYFRTAAHVVWDKYEAKHTTCYFFFDDPKDEYKSLKYKISRLEMVNVSNSGEDRCNLRFHTDDLDLLEMLDKKCQEFDNLRKIVNNKDKNNHYWRESPEQEPESKLTVIISHPHCCSKQVSIGEWIERGEEGDNQTWTYYRYTNQTCPGSSGGSVFVLSSTWLWCDHPHKGGSPLQNVSESGYGRDNFPRPKPLERVREAFRQGFTPELSFDEVLPCTLEFAKDRDGAKFLQDMLHGATTNEIGAVLDGIKSEIHSLTEHEYGYIVIEKLVQICSEAERLAILDKIRTNVPVTQKIQEGTNIAQWSRNKYGSAVVQKLIEHVQDVFVKIQLVNELAESVSASADGDEFDGSVSASADGDEFDGGVSASAGGDEFDGSVSASARGDEFDGRVSASAGGDEFDGSVSASAGGDEFDGSVSASAGGDKLNGSISDLADKKVYFDESISIATIDERYRSGEASTNSELHGSALTLDPHGHKVIIACFRFVDSQHVHILVDGIKNKVTYLCTNEYGSAVLQQVLLTNNSEYRALIIKEIIPKVKVLAIDGFGSNVLQCILKHCLDNEKAPVMQKLCENFEEIAKHRQGIDVIKQALDIFLEVPHRQFTKQLLQRTVSFAKDGIGNSVVLRCLKELRSVTARNDMLMELLANTKDLLNTGHGCAVIRFIIEDEDLGVDMAAKFVRVIGENVLECSLLKHASEVSLSCLESFPSETAMFVENLLRVGNQKRIDPVFCTIASSTFGHKVVLKMLQVAGYREYGLLQTRIRNCILGLLDSGHGRDIVGKLDCPVLTKLKENPNAELPVKDLILHAVELSIDPDVCNYLEQKLRSMTLEDLVKFGDNVLQVAHKLTTETVGHKLVVTLLKIGTPEVLGALEEMFTGSIFTFSQNKFGSRVLRKALACMEYDKKVKIVAELETNVVECCKDKHGYKVIKECLKLLDGTHVQEILRKIIEKLPELSRHQYGGLVIQHILQHCSEEQKRLLLESAQHHPDLIEKLACHRYGYNVIICAIQHCSGQDAESLYRTLCTILLKLAKAEYGNKVVKALIEKSLSQELVDELSNHTMNLAKHSYGHNVISCILAKCQRSCNLSLLMETIHSGIEELSQDSHGVQVIKTVLTDGSEEDKAKVATAVKKNLVVLRQDPRARLFSEIVKTCLEHISHTEKTELIRVACRGDNENEPMSHVLMSDNRYGQDVMFKMMKVARNEQIPLLVSEIKKHLPNLRQTMAGTLFLFKLEEFCLRNDSVRDENGN